MKRAFRTFKAKSAILLKSIKMAEGWDVGIVYHTVSSAEEKEEISDYIVFSENEELWKEESRMFSLSQCIYEDGLEEGIEKGIEKGIAAFVLDYVEENIPKEKCVQKLQKRFSLTKEKAEEYYERFVGRT